MKAQKTLLAGALCALVLCCVEIGWSQEPEPGGTQAPDATAPDDPAAADESEDSAAEPTLADVQAAAKEAADAANNAWMLTCSALVLMMTAPGLAMFYSGLVRKKNVLGVMMQCVFLMGLMTVIWALWGYSLAFGGDDPWIGNGDYLFMQNVEPTWDAATGQPVVPMEGAIPRLTHMLFQGMFFIITPALICGAFAERMKFSTMVVFMVLWGTLVYCPLCHWVWDGGKLAYRGAEAYSGGALDFAGGTVVHISSGVSALICALLIGKRLGHGSEPMPPHNLTYTALGAALLWVGWFGFNAGSELASDGVAANAFAVTHFAAAAGALAWAFAEWIVSKKPTVLGTCSGAVAGLVCITPASGFVTPMPALVMGAAAGLVCYFACAVLKNRFGYDDSLDAFGVHGVGGTLGAVLTGVFATRAVSNLNDGLPLGVLDVMRADTVTAADGREATLFGLLIGQVVAVVITWAFAAVATVVLLKILDVTMGLRVTQQQELEGLDISQHGEEGYIMN